MKWQVVETKKGTRCRVLEGGSGAPVVFFHGAGGLLRDNPYPRRAGAALSRVRARVARLRRLHR